MGAEAFAIALALALTLPHPVEVHFADLRDGNNQLFYCLPNRA